mgnify:CR=1 FL=1
MNLAQSQVKVGIQIFVDFEGNLEEPAVKNALRGLEAEANRMRVLGNYGQQEEQ